MTKILVVDNYDSFVFNLVQYLQQLGAEVVVKRNPKKKIEKVEPSYSQLADMSVEQQIKNKLQQEKITCFFNQLTGKKF